MHSLIYIIRVIIVTGHKLTQLITFFLVRILHCFSSFSSPNGSESTGTVVGLFCCFSVIEIRTAVSRLNEIAGISNDSSDAALASHAYLLHQVLEKFYNSCYGVSIILTTGTRCHKIWHFRFNPHYHRRSIAAFFFVKEIRVINMSKRSFCLWKCSRNRRSDKSVQETQTYRFVYVFQSLDF